MALNKPNLGASADDGTGSTAREVGQMIRDIIEQTWDTVTGGIAYTLGKVGIGISIPLFQGHVVGDTSTTIFAVENSTVDNVGIFFRINAVNKWRIGTINLTEFRIRDEDAGAERFIIDSSGNVLIGKISGNSKLAVSGLPVYANNAAALVGGLTEGDFYKTASTGDATVMVTNAT